MTNVNSLMSFEWSSTSSKAFLGLILLRSFNTLVWSSVLRLVQIVLTTRSVLLHACRRQTEIETPGSRLALYFCLLTSHPVHAVSCTTASIQISEKNFRTTFCIPHRTLFITHPFLHLPSLTMVQSWFIHFIIKCWWLLTIEFPGSSTSLAWSLVSLVHRRLPLYPGIKRDLTYTEKRVNEAEYIFSRVSSGTTKSTEAATRKWSKYYSLKRSSIAVNWMIWLNRKEMNKLSPIQIGSE